MHEFKEYVRGELPLTGLKELVCVVDRYPWFTTARIALARQKAEIDRTLALYFFVHPAPKPFLESLSPIEFTHQSTDEIIDAFLLSGEHRIVPQEDVPECELPSDAFLLDDDADMVSEELAEIYLKQGHRQQAKEIYEKLSLLYPKKSVYFAEIINSINDN